MKLTLISPYGVSKEVKTGWSWTTFLFGIFPALFRGDIKWAAIMFLVHLVALSVTAGIGTIVTIPLFAAIYNKLYITDLINQGYKCQSESQEQLLRSYITF